MRLAGVLLGLVAALVVAHVSPADTGGLPASWTPASVGPDGGAVWQGRIPDEFVHWDHRASAVYLPPGYTPSRRYPVIYLLHGMRGSPASYWSGLRLASVADGVIASGRAKPFIAVMPAAGPRLRPDAGEWAGIWEKYLVSDVVPWVDSHLPTLADPRNRALEGLCAGGYGAVDIGLRHPGLFDTLGSWEGYFAPVFRDGPFVHSSPLDLARHNPELLVRLRLRELLRDRVRFYISAGGNHGDVLRRWSLAFAQELTALHLPRRLWLLPRSERGHFWRATVPSALVYGAADFSAPAVPGRKISGL